MKTTYLIITSIAKDDHPVLKQFATGAAKYDIPFILIGDTKSPEKFELQGCEYFSISKQQSLDYELARTLPVKHYARKNLGYLEAISRGAEIIIETDDDNYPLESFWKKRQKEQSAAILNDAGWVNVYKYFTDLNIWPRGFALEELRNKSPDLPAEDHMECPIQQGLADENPDVDAIYRLTLPLPLKFDQSRNIALGKNSICPFNSQNTTWFREAFPLLYLPSYCSFRMTDIWRSFIAQRIAWVNKWPVLFHSSTVWQERNDHNLMVDFEDEIPGYLNNSRIMSELQSLDLKAGTNHLGENLIKCYEALVENEWVGEKEVTLVEQWNAALENFL